MQFGIQIEPQFGFTFEDVRDIARDAEGYGLHAIWVSDHLFLNADATATNCLEAWQLLAALSQTTSRLRLGPLVTSQSYRNPALLAKIAAGLDHISGGRLEFGLGTGWKELEYRAYGYEFPPPGVRIAQLVEALEICVRMWTQERATFHGVHYQIVDALCAPKPVQRPRPRIWIGGSRPRLLRVAARYADALNVGGFPTLEEYGAVMEALDRDCLAIGRDPGEILRSHFTLAALAETRHELDAVLDDVAGRVKLSRAEWLRARPSAIVGTPDEVLERLRAFAAQGMGYFIPLFPYGHERAMLRVLGTSVLPALAR